MDATNLYAFIEGRPGHPLEGQPFYVGIGTAKRPRTHLKAARSAAGHRNWRLQEVLAAHFLAAIEPEVRIIASFINREDAGIAEKAMISMLGRAGLDDGGILTNLAVGGQGPDHMLMKLPEIAERNRQAQLRRSPESRAASDAALVAALTDPAVQARRRQNLKEPTLASWKDEAIRDRRVSGMTGKAKTMTPEAIAQRQASAQVPRSEEGLAAMRAATERNWADPEFRTRRSASQAEAWKDPQKRARMEEGRSEGIAKSWEDPDVRTRRTAGAAKAVAAKWRDDPDYAARARAALKASWDDPVKKAERIAKMLASRAAKAPVRNSEVAAARSARMTEMNATRSAEDRTAEQAKAWADPAIRERRLAGLRAAAQDPEVKAARLAAMARGKQAKAAAKAAAALASPTGVDGDHG